MQGSKPLGFCAIVRAAAGCLLTAALGLQSASAVTLAETSFWQPALAAFNGKLYLAFTGTDRQLRVISSFDGLTFGSPIIIPNNSSQFGPGLAAFNGRLYLAWAGTDNRHKINWITSTDGVTWGGQTVFGNEASGVIRPWRRAATNCSSPGMARTQPII